eukprot:COSAG01_NODE_42296_length_441_cov_1.619883_2_plen_95_part_01
MAGRCARRFQIDPMLCRKDCDTSKNILLLLLLFCHCSKLSPAADEAVIVVLMHDSLLLSEAASRLKADWLVGAAIAHTDCYGCMSVPVPADTLAL